MTTSAPLIDPDFFPDPHDPSGQLQGPWRVLLECPAGVQPSAATVVAVDEQDYPLPFDATGLSGDSLVVSSVTISLATDQPPNTWAINFYTQYGSLKTYRIRTRYTLNTIPAVGKDKTMLLLCAQG